MPMFVRCRTHACAFALVVGVFVASPVHAEPGSASDAVELLLIERGLVPDNATQAPETSIARDTSLRHQVREAASEMVISAMKFLGVPYKRGGTSAETGFDCSGFTRHVFENSLGLLLPRRADEQARAPGLVAVKRDDLKPGDLVFFNTLRQTFSHVGIYVGEGKFIHSPRAGAEVRIEDMRFAYWAKRFTGARRAEADTAARSLAPALAPPNVSLSPGTAAEALSGNAARGLSAGLLDAGADLAAAARSGNTSRAAVVPISTR